MNFTTVDALFRAYDSLEHSLADHSAFLIAGARYANLIGERDYKTACAAIHKAGYATDPGYAEKLIKLIEQYRLTDYDAVSGKDAKTMKIYLSPSNQPANKYAVGNTNEKAEMEAVAARIKTILDRDYNCTAVMATLSMGISSNERPLEAKNKGCEYYIAIHSNAAGSSPSNASGAVSFFHPDSAKSKALAQSTVAELNSACPIKSNRASQVVSGMTQFNGSGYGEIRSPWQRGLHPVLIEVNFHDNPTTARYIIDNKDSIAAAVVKALVSTLGIGKKGGSVSVPAPVTPPPAQTTPVTPLPAPVFQPYMVKVTVNELNIRKGPGTNHAVAGSIKDRGTYTIVEEANGNGASKWGRLKSDAGWIALDFTERR